METSSRCEGHEPELVGCYLYPVLPNLEIRWEVLDSRLGSCCDLQRPGCKGRHTAGAMFLGEFQKLSRADRKRLSHAYVSVSAVRNIFHFSLYV